MTRREEDSVMRAYKRLMIFGALALIGMAATIVVQGGWQAAAAAFAIFTGGGFTLTFTALRAASERPRSRHPSWAAAADRPRHRVAAEPGPRPAPVSTPDTSQAASSGRRPLAPRPARSV
jgi:hypothetical protein